MTNHWIDLQHSDCILIQGSNAAENHPISFKWVLKAKDKGAEVIHVDPRFTRTSARSSMYAPLRSGTDIAFLGGMIKYILDHDLYFKDYVLSYTNAAFLVNPKFSFNDGLFSGYDAQKHAYDKSSWSFQKDGKGLIKRDDTLKNPHCVFQLMKKHYDRYDLKKVSSITGTPEADLLAVYKAFAATGKPDKAGTIMYALGQCHHSVAVQNIRTMTIVQLLLGNIGICGGGINALRGEPNVQGSTDHALLSHYLPGYLKAPKASWQTLEQYIAGTTPQTANPQSLNWMSNTGKYATSLMRAFYPEGGTPENGFGYDYLPKLDDGQDASVMSMIDAMYAGKIKGLTCVGQNPACSLPNSNKVRKALQNLDWMVHVNIFDNETASFWKGPGLDPKKVKTECFLLPVTASVEKEGSQANSGRWMQWKYAAAEGPGDAISTGDVFWRVMSKLKELYAKDGGTFPEPILAANTDFVDGKGRYDPERVAKYINGYFLKDVTINGVEYKKGECVPGFPLLQADGSTSCGNWICSGSFTRAGENLMRRRKKVDPTGLGLYPEWSYSWPVNRRVIYNRASVDPQGKPWNPKKALVQWKDGQWIGDVPDGPAPPLAMQGGKLPFIMQPEGLGALYGPGLAEGPFPEHYEPMESPFKKNIMSAQRVNPALHSFGKDMNPIANASPDFPLVMTTYSCTEHWCTGAFTRWQPWLVEAQPQAYVEISEELAKEKGIANGEKVRISSARGTVDAVAMVTVRLTPFKCGGKTVHQVGMTFNYGWLQPKECGDTVNLLSPMVGDANSMTPEYKAFMVNIDKIKA